jgi:hypothetical protein
MESTKASFGRKSTLLMNCAGHGGNPSSKAAKKSGPNPKAPKTDVFAAKK